MRSEWQDLNSEQSKKKVVPFLDHLGAFGGKPTVRQALSD